MPHPSSLVDPAAPLPPAIDEADAPDDLDPDSRKVWLELAPFALKNGTLTPAMSIGFKMLCRNVVLECQYANSVMDRGGPKHRGIIDKVDRELLRFGLAPCGKAVPQETPKPAVDPLKARYFGGR